MPRGIDREHLEIFKGDGDRIVDKRARKVLDRTFSDKGGGLAVPTRPPTPLSRMKELNRAPINVGAAQIETSSPPKPGQDSHLILHLAYSLFDGVRQGMITLDPKAEMMKVLAAIFAVGVTIGVIFALYIYSQDREHQRALDLMEAEQRGINAPVVEPAQPTDYGVTNDQQPVTNTQDVPIQAVPQEALQPGGSRNTGQ